MDDPRAVAYGLTPRIVRGRTVTASLHTQDGSSHTVYAKTEEHVAVVAIPFRIGPHFRPGVSTFSSLGYEIAFDASVALDPITLAGVFANLSYAPGADLPPVRGGTFDPPRPSDDNRTRAVLDSQNRGPFDRDQAAIVDRWIDASRWWKPYPPEAIAMVGRILHDPRVGAHSP